MMNSSIGMSGKFNAKHIRATPHSARSIRIPGFGRIILTRDQGDAGIFGREVFGSHLVATHYRDSEIVQAYDLGSGVVTTAGVVKLSQDTAISAGSAAFNAFKYHGSGTGTTAAAVGDTALQTAIGTTATASAGNTNATVSTNATVTSVATVAYSGSAAVTEWGLFNSATLAGATMWDHKIFAAINVVNLDSIQFTYVLTLTAGS